MAVSLFPIENYPFCFSARTPVFKMAGYLDYWCNLDVTGTAERDILTFQLKTEFEDFKRMVDTLIQAREERRREIARELEPLEVRFFGHYYAEATTRGMDLTPLLLENMHALAHRKAVTV
ncbi:hypothetical protein BT96DRAFT_948166 [Gymnopus androsaceus JB14]|uniref:Uncharacterized protein n=1 Tax=Gymnopus androsaceus JB14 TaxID=1447944 RepID=A0A6A4GR30_9AGAR|nr:hypothetical protein BT96DRAFT_948166 [Gymnopus androsaceus JB14]